MRKIIFVLLIYVVFLAGCAGRKANPIAIYLPGDENRRCAALKAEITQLQTAMQYLLPKTNAEKIEFEAMRRRHNRLLIYVAERNCAFGEVKAERIPSIKEHKAKETKKN